MKEALCALSIAGRRKTVAGLAWDRPLSVDGACSYCNLLGAVHRSGGPALDCPSSASRNGPTYRASSLPILTPAEILSQVFP